MPRTFTVARGYSGATIGVTRQTQLVISDDAGNEVLVDRSNTREVVAHLPPGRYTIHTDGRVGNIGGFRRKEQTLD